MVAPVIPSFAGVTPNRTQSAAEFSTNADAWLTYMDGIEINYNESADFVNATAADVDADAASADASADAALTSETNAASSANFKGGWADLTGSLAVPSSVFHDSFFWQLLVNLADVTTSEPGITTDWTKLDQSNRITNNVILHFYRNR